MKLLCYVTFIDTRKTDDFSGKYLFLFTKLYDNLFAMLIQFCFVLFYFILDMLWITINNTQKKLGIEIFLNKKGSLKINNFFKYI